MLKLQVKNTPTRSIWLVGNTLTLGKGKTNHLVIDDPFVEDIHAEVQLRGDEIYLVDKAGSKTIVNGQEIDRQQLINLGDVIRLNTVELEVVDPKVNRPKKTLASQQVAAPVYEPDTGWYLVAIGSWLDGRKFSINKTSTVGRDAGCDIVIPGTHLSRLHAELKIQGNSLHIRDLGSSNGTFLNEESVMDAKAKPGDLIRFDILTFRLEGPEPEYEKTQMRPALNIQPVPTRKSRPSQEVMNSQEKIDLQTIAEVKNREELQSSSSSSQGVTAHPNNLLGFGLVATAILVVGLAFVFFG